jgi:hypothetical protein
MVRQGSPAARHPRPATRDLAARLAAFKRLYRWLNLTLVQQATWPLLVLLAGAPLGPVPATPLPWYLMRVAGPAVAAALALIYLAQRPGSPSAGAASDDNSVLVGAASPAASWRGQVRLLLPGLALVVAAARLLAGPVEPVAKLILFGLAEVAAYQLIHFGVVARSFAPRESGQAAAVGLFALSSGLGRLFLAGVAGATDLLVTFGVGCAVGLAIALMSRGLRRWPGGFWPAAAAHWLVVYLILGFVG